MGYLFVNFGGPRNLEEIESFLTTLLTDKEVIRTQLPSFFHNYLFKKVARKRAVKIKKDYALIGGKSPIFEDTEFIANYLRSNLNAPVATFHRYIPQTHQSRLEQIEKMDAESITIFPFFPQFSYATTGSIARFFSKKLSKKTQNKLRWIKSYPTHPAYIDLFSKCIEEFLLEKRLREEEVILLFSAHGLPCEFIDTGDLYATEVQSSYFAIANRFPQAKSKLAYQSKFGPGKWLSPSTEDVCRDVKSWNEGRRHLIFIPLSFTSDHIETLFEVEKQYMPIVAEAGLKPYRLPAFNRRSDWMETICQIMSDTTPVSNGMLVR